MHGTLLGLGYNIHASFIYEHDDGFLLLYIGFINFRFLTLATTKLIRVWRKYGDLEIFLLPINAYLLLMFSQNMRDV